MITGHCDTSNSNSKSPPDIIYEEELGTSPDICICLQNVLKASRNEQNAMAETKPMYLINTQPQPPHPKKLYLKLSSYQHL
jgi:hypothetical protein